MDRAWMSLLLDGCCRMRGRMMATHLNPGLDGHSARASPMRRRSLPRLGFDAIVTCADGGKHSTRACTTSAPRSISAPIS